MGLIPVMRPPGIIAGGGGGPTTVLEDYFTSGSGDLDAWTPTDVGDGYIDDTTNGTTIVDIIVDNGHIRFESNDTDDRRRYYTDPSPSGANQRVTIIIDEWRFPGDEDMMQYTLRATSGGGGYVLSLHRVSFNETITLEYQANATSKTALGSYTVPSAANGDEIIFEIVGTSLTVDFNGTERISATDSNLSAAGEMAVGGGFGASTRNIASLMTRIASHKFEEL